MEILEEKNSGRRKRSGVIGDDELSTEVNADVYILEKKKRGLESLGALVDTDNSGSDEGWIRPQSG